MKRRIVYVSFELFRDFLLGRLRPVTSSAPEDIEVVGVFPINPGTAGVVVVSGSFENVEVPEGAEIPELEVFFSEVKDPE
jgi:hypothetical protein